MCLTFVHMNLTILFFTEVRAESLFHWNLVQQKITTVLVHLIKDFTTALLAHLYLGAYCNEVLEGRVAGVVD